MSTLVLDTITGKSTATTITIGSTPVVSASATSMTIRGEGSAQTSIQQGLCKAWHLSSAAAVPADSFNISGGTDNGTGDYSYAFSNNMGNVNYAPSGLCATDDRNAQYCRSRAADTYRTKHYGHDDAFADVINSGSIAGDLA